MKRTYTFGISSYIQKALQKLAHVLSSRKVNTPKNLYPITFGRKIQKQETYTSDKAREEQQKRLQYIIGTFLYYVRIIELKICITLSNLLINQTTATKNTSLDANQVMHFLYSHQNATKTF